MTVATIVGSLAVMALVAGGVTLLRGGQERQKGVLMLVAALVLAANIAIVSF